MQNNNEGRLTHEEYEKLKSGKKPPKRKKKKGKVFTKKFRIFLLILFIATVLYTLFTNNYFKISQVFVDGNNYYSKEEILGKIDNPLSASIFTYKTRKERKKLEADPYIEDAKVKKIFPSTLKIKVGETYPLFSYEGGGQTAYVSNKGKIISLTSDFNRDNLIVLKANLKIPKIGDNIGDEKIINFLSSIESLSYRPRIKEINLEKESEIGIILDDIDVEFGDLNNIDYKFKLLDSVLRDIKQRNADASLILLDEGENPIVKYGKIGDSSDVNHGSDDNGY